MIRPITCVGFLMACASGLYLYQAKHRVNVIDQQIEKTVRAAAATREQIRLLHAEWTLLNQPDRLQQMADRFLALKPTTPSQFTSMADLDSRLPPIPVPAEAAPDAVASGPSPVASPAEPVAALTPRSEGAAAPGPAAAPASAPVAVASAEPARVSPSSAPAPVRKPVLSTKAPEPAPAGGAKAAERPRLAAEARPLHSSSPERVAATPQLPALARPDVIRAAAVPRPYWPQPRPAFPAVPQPAYRPAYPSGGVPMGGSLLGIAHTRTEPPPPIPLASGGGG